MPVKPVPEGYHTATPYLVCKGASAAIDYYKKAFGAVEQLRHAAPDGKVGHAEIKIGDSIIMLADESPEMGHRAPQPGAGSPFGVMLYVEDVDTLWRKAIAAGGKELKALTDQFYGDRSGTLVDPFGHTWTLATHIEDVSPEEMNRRAGEAMKVMKEKG